MAQGRQICLKTYRLVLILVSAVETYWCLTA
jgi:hypothetical protein